MRTLSSLTRLAMLCVAVSFDLLAQEYYTRLSGIDQGDSKAPIIGYPGMSSATDIHVYPSPYDQSEVSIASNWCNTQNLLIGSNVVGSTSYSQGYFYSENGGYFWAGGEAIPNAGYVTSDPAVTYDAYNIGNPNGYADGYFNYLEYVGFTYNVIVRKTTNGGVTWSDPVSVPGAGDPDKNHIVADPTMGTYGNYVYTGFTDFTFFPGSPIKISRSTNRGTSFSTPVNISLGATSLFSQGVNLAVGPAGEVYAVWAIYDDWDDGDPNVWAEEAIGFARSTNGGATWQAPSRILEIEGIRNRWTHKNSGGSSTPIRVNSFPSIAVDRSGGPYQGHIYLVWANKGAGIDKADIQLSKSINGGASWSTPVRVNNDNTTYDQWFPSITVSLYGRITIDFYDSRSDNVYPVNQATETWIAQSTDDGQTFENLRVSDVSFVPVPIPNTGTGYMGDYLGITSKPGTAYSAWMDNRTGVYQVFVDIYDSYTADLLNAASWNRSPFALATALGSGQKVLYGGSKWHRIFQVNQHIAYSSSTDDGVTWTGHALINGTATGWLSNPSLLYSANKLHVVFKTDFNQIYYVRGTTSGVWEQPRLLSTLSGPITGISAVVDAAGICHVIITQGNSNPSGNNLVTYGTFNTADLNPLLGGITQLVSTYGALSSPAITVEPNNTPHVVWASGGEILYRYKTGSSWSSIANISGTSTPSSSPTIVVVSNCVHVSWQEHLTLNNEVYYKSKLVGGSWGVTQNLSNNATSSIEPCMSGPVSGEPLVVWADSSGTNFDVRYKFPVSGTTGSFTSTSAQSHNPAFGFRSLSPGTRVVLLCTDGSNSLYQIAADRKDFNVQAKSDVGGTLSAVAQSRRETVLQQNTPNPFNPSTMISFDLPEAGLVQLKVFDLIGREVVSLVNDVLESGSHHVEFNGGPFPSGIYFYRLQYGGGTVVRRMVLLK